MATLTKTNVGLNLVRDGESGANNPKLLYVALGTGNTAPSVNDTQLVNEVFRKGVTSWTNGASVGEILVSCYIAPSEAVGFNIQEVGVFGGNTASSTPNSGVLLGRGLYSHLKLSTENITVQLDLTFS